MFGIGAPEILFILFLALLIMGPDDLQKTGRTLGIWMRRLVMSDTWKMLRKTSKELQDLPAKLMREANPDLDTQALLPDLGTWNRTIRQPLEALERDIKNTVQQTIAWPPPDETPPAPSQPPKNSSPNAAPAEETAPPPSDSNEATL
jgi:Sec-independent protein translocase protein TatA